MVRVALPPALALAFAFPLALACSEPVVELAGESVTSDGECGQLGCNDELRVSLVARAGVFDGGTYSLVTTIGEVTESCGFALSGEASDCDGDPPCAIDNDCDAEFGFAVLPHFVVLRVPATGESVRLGVARDATSLVDVTLAPEYEDYYPNGSDCAPVCAIASAAIDVP